MSTNADRLAEALKEANEALPKMGERETVYCTIRGDHLRTLLAALAQQQASVPLKLPEQMALDGHDKNHNGYHWRLGWNAALRSVLDYNTASPTPTGEKT